MISEKIGNHFYCDFLEVIRPEIIEIAPFGIKGKSLIFTSVNGVKGCFKNGFTIQKDQKIYCVGSKTKKAVEKERFSVFKVGDDAKDLSQFIKNESPNERFIHFCGTLSLDILSEEIEKDKYQKIEVYETHLLYPTINTSYDALVFFSPSGVRSFAKNNSLENAMLFSIGKTTESELKKFTNNRVYYSDRSNINELLSIIKEKGTL